MICVAYLTKLKSDDGLMEMRVNINIGRMYMVETDSLRESEFFNVDRAKLHRKMVVDVVDENGTKLGILPCELITTVWEDRHPVA